MGVGRGGLEKEFFVRSAKHAFDASGRLICVLVNGREVAEDLLDECRVVEGAAPHRARELKVVSIIVVYRETMCSLHES